MRRVVRGISRMGAREIWFRSREKARTIREAVHYVAGRSEWRRERLRSALLPTSNDLIEAGTALGQRNWQAAEESLRRHFTKRPSRFLIDPARRMSIASAVRELFPAATDDAVRRADRLLAGSYDLLGYRDLQIGVPANIDWHFDPVHHRRAPHRFWASVPYLDPTYGDHKVIWELNRHQHWLALGRAAWLSGDKRYPEAFRAQLNSWLASNPPLTGINWASMLELGFRAISWLWSLHFFVSIDDDATDSAWLTDLLLAIEAQLNHIAGHLSRYFSPNTHLLGEGLALYVAGRVLPELRAAPRWEGIGREILREEAGRQVNADGGHAELSTHYHRYALDFYLFALNIARLTKDPLERELIDVSSRLADFCRSMVDNRGYLPTIGDDDGGLLFPLCGRAPADVSDSLALAASLLDRPEFAVTEPREETLWMLGGDRRQLRSPATSQTPPSRLFADTGYAILRSTDAQAIVDVGRHGFLNGGHAHADALSVIMSIEGRPFLVDPGTSTYTIDAKRRDLFRSTAMHNTVTVDGRPQSMPASPFQWTSAAHATAHLWQSSEALDVVVAEHDGYLPQVHRRTVLRARSGLWLIADQLLGSGSHRVDVRWHIDPAWTTERVADGVANLRHSEGLTAGMATSGAALTSVTGEELGWYAPVYGQQLPAVVLTATEEGAAPLFVVTAIAAGPASKNLSVETTEITPEYDDTHHFGGIRGTYGDGRFLALFATAPAPAAQPRALRRLAIKGNEFHTDAEIAVLGLTDTLRPAFLSLVNATRAQWTGPAAFSIGPFTSAADLHLDRTAVSRLSHTTEPNGSAINRMERSLCAE